MKKKNIHGSVRQDILINKLGVRDKNHKGTREVTGVHHPGS